MLLVCQVFQAKYGRVKDQLLALFQEFTRGCGMPVNCHRNSAS